MASKRSKNFATIVYPESTVDNFVDVLKEQKVSFLLSPLHDKDVNIDGTAKKSHYHLILIFDSLKSIDQVKEVISCVNAVGCEVVNSLVNYGRYLCHLDDKDKYQYPINEVVSYGYDYESLIASKSDKYDLMAKIVDFCVETQCTSFYRLMLYARHKDFEMFKLLCDNSYFIREFLRSSVADLKDDKLKLENTEWQYSGGFDEENPFPL